MVSKEEHLEFFFAGAKFWAPLKPDCKDLGEELGLVSVEIDDSPQAMLNRKLRVFRMTE